MYPVGGWTTRVCTAPTTLTDYKDKQIKIKKGVVAYIPLWSVQRDPEYYSDPLKFYPERFNAEFGGIKKYKDMGVFLPFGDGPRICLGNLYKFV